MASMCVATGAFAATCENEDFTTRVSGASECLLMRRFGPERPATLLVWLHGNVSTGGPADSHFRMAEKASRLFAAQRVLAVALVRPGYPDGTGESSSGDHNGRIDNWRQDTIVEIGTVIERLRARYQPDTVVLVGHSGGAAIAAVLLGMRPRLADAALLIGCPCELVAWRAGRGGWPWLSENPMQWIGGIDAAARVIALTGATDATTPPALARTYVDALRRQHIEASFESVAGAGHLDILNSVMVWESAARLLHR